MATNVEGLDAATAALKQAADDVKALDMTTTANEAAGVMRGFVPVASGRARSRIRPDTVPTKAVVILDVPYATPLRATHPSRFVQRTDDVMARRLPELAEAEWDDIAQRNGLT